MYMYCNRMRLRPLSAAVAMAVALSLTACGGGAGNVRPPPSAPASGPPPAPAPAPAPPPQPPLDAQLALTDTYAAHDAGYTGRGVTIGVVDTGVNHLNPALVGRVTTPELVYLDSTTNDLSKDDVVGHGTWVSEIAAGKPYAQFPGGIAPDATIVSARIIQDKTPTGGGGTAVQTSDASFFANYLNPDLINAGVQVMNNSWGGLYWDPTNASAVGQAFAAAFRPFVVNHGGIVVFATGNDGNAQPSDTAAIPYWGADLEVGWIAAAALDSLHPTQLASYSNACGKAMNYCISAPGDVIVLDAQATTSTSPLDYYIVEGTSFAAPEVSGAAAVVWQAFPYFNNDMVRQTLLGTASDLGAPGVDPVFGWGALDVGKAVKGPANFAWGDVSVSFDGMTSTWSNDIVGAGGLSKNGTGILVLAGSDRYTGDTRVLGGSLQSAHELPGNVNVSSGAVLSGVYAAGNVAVGVPGAQGNLDNAGTVIVAGGDATVGGNYHQASTGTLDLSLGSRLNVTGLATIDGGTLDILGEDSGYVSNSHQNLITAAGGVSGTFTTLAKASGVFLSSTLQYDAHDVWIDTTSLSITAAATTAGFSSQPAVMSSATRLDTSFSQVNSGLASGSITPTSSFVSAAGAIQHTQTLDAARVALQSLSGELHAASAAMTFEAIDASNLALSRRFDQLLENGSGYGMWSRNLSMRGDMSRSGYDGVNFQLNGWLVGADQRLGANGIAGYAFGQSQADQRLNQRIDRTTSRDTEAMAYVGWLHGNSYVQGRIGFGSVNQDISRALLLGPSWQGVSTHYNGTYSVVYGESGLHFDAGGGTQFTPYVDVQYAQLRRNGFTEQGGYGFGLTAGANTLVRWQAGAGIRAARHLELSGGRSIDFTARAQWQQTLASSGDVFDASFVGMQDWQPLVGIGVSRYSGLFGVGMDAHLGSRSVLHLRVDDQFGQRVTARRIMARYTFTF